jgi:hypothetical protein
MCDSCLFVLFFVQPVMRGSTAAKIADSPS